MISAELEMNQADFEYLVSKEIVNHIQRAVNRNIGSIESEIRKAVYDRLMTSNFYNQFTTGMMYHEIGNPNAARDLQVIFRTIANHLIVKSTISLSPASVITGDIELSLLESSYQDLFSLTEASYHSINKSGRDTLIEWLKWLLTGGGGPLVYYFEFKYGPKYSAGSRTGDSLMILTGKNWGLRAQWAGTRGDNVLTRELAGVELTFIAIVDKKVISRL